MIDIEIDDRQVRQALQRIQRRISDISPVMRDIGELLAERAKQRFATSTGPDGQQWAPNAPATIAAWLAAYGGNFKKRGGLTKQGAARAASKKPLVGESRALSTTIYYQAGGDSVTIGSPMVYAAIHQFGGQAGRGRRVTIPPRPFLPITASGQWLGDADRAAVLDIIGDALRGALDGRA
ncbi:phage virion morphogenesis protein [Azohydromonas sediminis]|uniref:phage virion morphogenesis protein n=1 Tax=Azohydromonas sediminis TaxID=2259674 RepID=UPI000E65A6EC|nr:phage virion morphogenesis protein [Azohydromonas sediminis]